MTRITSNKAPLFFIVLFLTSVFCATVQAQTTSIRLEGIAWNPSGDPIEGVILTAVEDGTGREYETTSDSDGYYRFLALPPGTYTVTAKTRDFKDVILRGISLFSPDTVTENFSFEVSAIDKEIPAGDTARINDSANSGFFPNSEINAFPLPDRDPMSLLVYQPGVQINGGKEAESTVNGTRQGMNRTLVDGLSISDPLDPGIGSSLVSSSPDSIADIQIMASGAKAQYGGSGGGYFSIASRAGTKSWHGSVYDYFGHEKMNANEFFVNAANLSRPAFTRNIFGGTASGPIDKKTRVFANIDINRTNQTRHAHNLVLREDARAGLFQWYEPDDTTRDETTVKSFDIVANDPRGLGIDPAIAAQFVKLPDDDYINDTLGDGLNTGGYLYETPVPLRQELLAVRVDRDLSKSHKLFFRFNWQRANSTDTKNDPFASFTGVPSPDYKDNSWSLMGGSDWAISPKMVNELRIGFIRSEIKLERPGRTAGAMTIPNSWTNLEDPSFPSSYKAPGLEISDSFSHSLNVHSLKYGASFRRTYQKSNSYIGAYPNVTFGTDSGNGPESSIGPSDLSDISPADRDSFERLYNDLLGRIESVSLTYYSSLSSVSPAGTANERSFASSDFSVFIQDDWKIRRNLTLNLGLRYDIFTPPKEQNGFQSALDKASQIANSSGISDFTIAGSDKWYSTDMKNFAPRVGAAWDIKGNGSLVLRGAYGMYFDRLNGAITRFVDQNSYGFSQTRTIYPNENGTDLRLSDGVPVPEQPPAPSLQPSAARSGSVAVINPALRTPRVDQFNLTLEKRLWGAIFELGYAGARGKKLFQYTDLNQTKTDGDFLQAFQELQQYRDMGTPVPDTNTIVRVFGTPLAAFDALDGYNFDTGQLGRAANEMDLNYYENYAAAGVSDFYIRNFPQFDKVLYGSDTAKSWYDSFQFGIRKSSANYQFRFYYTWSKSLDTMSSYGDTYVSPLDSFNPDSNKAPSDFDRKHVLNIAWNYALPFGRDLDGDSGASPWINRLFSGWNLGVLLIRESGARFSIVSNRESRYGGVASLASYKDDLPPGKFYRSGGRVYWFDPETAQQFTYPAAGEAGSIGRNFYVGPTYSNIDAVLHKKFTWSQDKYVQVRVEAFNFFNNTHFGIPNNVLGEDNFGIITSTQGAPRSLQLALRLGF